MADKHLYDEHGDYKGRISDQPPQPQWPGIAVVLLAIALLLLLAPGIIFDLVTGRLGEWDYDFLDKAMSDPLTWGISIVTWILVALGFTYRKP